MSQQNYAREIFVKATPEQVFDALTTGYGHWWTKPGNVFSAVGDAVVFRFPPDHGHWTFEATEISAARIKLKCIDAHHIGPDFSKELEKEWLGTYLIWEFAPRGNQTRINFTHIGLTPALHCYDICEEGWDHFFVGSLKAYLETGTGTPFGA